MLVAKSDEAHWRVARQFENRTIQKTYMAVIHGVPELLADVIDMPIGQDRYVREKQAIRKEENGGRPAVTKYEVQEIFQTPPSPILRHGESSGGSRNPGPAAEVRLCQADAQNRPHASVTRSHGGARAIPWSATRCTAGASLNMRASISTPGLARLSKSPLFTPARCKR